MCVHLCCASPRGRRSPLYTVVVLVSVCDSAVSAVLLSPVWVIGLLAWRNSSMGVSVAVAESWRRREEMDL